jgi:hypothetical protein
MSLSDNNRLIIEIVDGWAIGEECDLPLDRIEALMNAGRQEERARADTITPAMINAAMARIQGPDDDMYSSIYRTMLAAAYLNDSREGGAS